MRRRLFAAPFFSSFFFLTLTSSLLSGCGSPESSSANSQAVSLALPLAFPLPQLIGPGAVPSATPGAVPSATPSASWPALDIPLTLEESAGVARAGEPVRSGIPMPRGLGLFDTTHLAIAAPDGTLVPAQFRVTSRWEGAPDDVTKPIKWVLVDFAASVPANAAPTYRLKTVATPPSAGGSMVATNSSSQIVVNTGAATFQISKTRFNVFDRVVLADGTVAASSDPNAGIYLTTPDGTRYLAAAGTTSVSVEEDGPLHAVVVARGKHASSAGAKLLDFEARMHFWKGRAESLVSYTFTDRDLPHITDYDSVAEAGVDLLAKPAGTLRYTFGTESADVGGTLSTQASLLETGALSPTLDGLFNPGNDTAINWSASGDASGTGGKAPGWMDVSGSQGGITVALRWFWQQYPKKLVARPGALSVVLWPADAGAMRVYAAAAKTHEMLYSFHGASVSGSANGRALAARLSEPLFARAEPRWYAESWVWGRIGTATPSDYPAADQALVNQYFSYILGRIYPSTFVTRRATGNGKGHAYSMWDFGDGREQDWSNLAYDTPRDLMLFWAITGNREFLDRAFESGAHLRDVDIEHSSLDTRAPTRSGRGVPAPWLGRTRYTPNGPNAHDLGNFGATGFGFEHIKGQSLADLYFLTGDALAKEVLVETYHYYLQWKVDADSGYLRTDGTRVVSHMLLIVLGYYDVFGTAEARSRADFIVNFLNDWQRRKTTNDPNGWMWMTVNDTTSAFMNGVTAEALMEYEVEFPGGIPVRQNLIDAAKFTVDPSKGLLVNGSGGHYFNAWTGDNYGALHASCLDPMTLPLLAYASAATGDPSYVTLSKEVLGNYMTQDQATPYIKAYTEQTKLMPTWMWFVQTPAARVEGSAHATN